SQMTLALIGRHVKQRGHEDVVLVNMRRNLESNVKVETLVQIFDGLGVRSRPFDLRLRQEIKLPPQIWHECLYKAGLDDLVDHLLPKPSPEGANIIRHGSLIQPTKNNSHPSVWKSLELLRQRPVRQTCLVEVLWQEILKAQIDMTFFVANGG